MINQRFYDIRDKYEYSEEDTNQKFEKDAKEFIINKVYGMQVIITNCSSSNQEV